MGEKFERRHEMHHYILGFATFLYLPFPLGNLDVCLFKDYLFILLIYLFERQNCREEGRDQTDTHTGEKEKEREIDPSSRGSLHKYPQCLG